jgi:lysophospholipase L1-like esterase
MNTRRNTKVILYIISVFVFQEVFFRFLFPIPEIKNFDRINFMHLSFDGSGSKHSRDLIRDWKSIPDTSATFQHNMNRYGFRDKEWTIEKPINKARALFIGDSFVEGVMANQNETIPIAFEKASDNQYETLNGGLTGCGLDSYLQLSVDMIPTFKPDVAFLCIYANDLGKNPPKLPEFFLEPELFNLYNPRLLELYNQIKTYGPINFKWNLKTTPYLTPVPDVLNPWTQSENILKVDVTHEIADKMKSSLFNPFLTNALAKEEEYLKKAPLIGNTLDFFKYVCTENGTKPIIVYIPSRNQISDYYLPFEREYCLNKCPDSMTLNKPEYQVHQQFLKKQCEDLNIQFIDLSSIIKEREEKGEHLYWNYDQHMRAKGYQIVGEEIWNQLN